VLNAGVSGFGTAEELLYLERELWKYSPDLVLLSFFANDAGDNARANLFRLGRDGALVAAQAHYVPAGRLGDALNRNALLGWLSEHSDAFVLVKERANDLMKGELERRNAEQASAPSGSGTAAAPQSAGYEQRLTLALLERFYAETHARGIPLVIQSIPMARGEPPELVETFPAAFDVARPGIAFLPMKPLLDPLRSRELVYWKRSQGHWTPAAHALAGRALFSLIEQRRLLPPPSGGACQRPSAPPR
jgi:hypothetical protein